MQNELIIVSEYCRKCHIEPSFIDLLQEGGLIEVMTILKGLMLSIICYSVWRRCRMNFMSCAVS